MIEQVVSDVFKRIGHSWKIKTPEGVNFIHPDEEDVRMVLDNATAALYDRDVGDTYTRGGLIVEKRPVGFDIYVYVGNQTKENE